MELKQETTFVLPVGVECTITELDSTHIETLTKVKGKEEGRTEKIIHSIITKLGDKSGGEITIKDIEGMTSVCKAKILYEARCFTLDSNEFLFDWEFDCGYKERFVKNLVPIEKPFPFYIKALKEKGIEYKEGDEIQPIFNNYHEAFEENKYVYFDFNGKKIRFNLLTEKQQSEKEKEYRDSLSALSPIHFHNTCALDKIGKEETWIPLPRKINYKLMNECLGQIRNSLAIFDTSVILKPKSSEVKAEKIDLITLPAFFLPSMGI